MEYMLHDLPAFYLKNRAAKDFKGKQAYRIFLFFVQRGGEASRTNIYFVRRSHILRVLENDG
jgi:hypothetical protein